ncbi:hypothetical protein [uncultured Clostridium sp.]|nr:hypothetical protein [uncultured Clostridium sp.]
MFTKYELMWLEELLEEKIAEIEEVENKGEAILNDLEDLKSALNKVKENE